MPYINIKVSKQTTASQRTQLKQKMGEAISLLSGKSEEYLMVSIEDGFLYLGGKELENGACVSVQHFGDAKPEELKQLGHAILQALGEILAMDPQDIYIVFGPGIETWTLFGDTYHTDIFRRK